MYSAGVSPTGQGFAPEDNHSLHLHCWVVTVQVLSGSSSPLTPWYQDTTPDAEGKKADAWAGGEAHLGSTC